MPRAIQHTLVVLYLAATLSAFLFTMFRVRPPEVLWMPFVRFSYGMMAPYQGYKTFNEDLTAAGRLPDGSWERIRLDPYFPYIRGERSFRSYFATFHWRSAKAETRAHRRFARKLLRLERQRGRPYTHLRLWRETWPMSPAGFAYLRREPFTERTLLAEVQWIASGNRHP